jgi:hypothetical protein
MVVVGLLNEVFEGVVEIPTEVDAQNKSYECKKFLNLIAACQKCPLKASIDSEVNMHFTCALFFLRLSVSKLLIN